ncbi:hypothetical protein MRB53_041489 [Persea americana]|nr:hypothetical protein MRB53_041489 [Persea americana]
MGWGKGGNITTRKRTRVRLEQGTKIPDGSQLGQLQSPNRSTSRRHRRWLDTPYRIKRHTCGAKCHEYKCSYDRGRSRAREGSHYYPTARGRGEGGDGRKKASKGNGSRRMEQENEAGGSLGRMGEMG